MAACTHECRLELARALCAVLGRDVAPPVANVSSAEVLPAGTSLLHTRGSWALWRELGCEADEGPPPLNGLSVENGKSGSAFMVPGGLGVSLRDSKTFSLIVKQINGQEAALLPSLYPELVDQYSRQDGSLLAPLLGWVRHTPAGGGEPFEAVLLQNVARRPPGIASDVASRWKPFDMKGIRLYAHEQRFLATFGEGGLRVGAPTFERLRRVLSADVHFLTRRKLVDFSLLVSVFPSGASPRPCAELRHAADYFSSSSRPPRPNDASSAPAAALIPAFYELSSDSELGKPRQPAEGAEEAVGGVGGVGGVRAEGASDDGARSAGNGRSGMCVPVLLRLSIIDYMREWRLTERVEHVRNTLVRDLRAGERNHAVVPVGEFGQLFEAFFAERILRPVPAAQEAALSLTQLLTTLLSRWASLHSDSHSLLSHSLLRSRERPADDGPPPSELCSSALGPARAAARWLRQLVHTSVHAWAQLGKAGP